MKNILGAIILGIMLAGVSLAQNVATSPTEPMRADKSTKPRLAVLEFNNSMALPYWDWEKSAQMQREMIKELTGTLDVPTREAVIAVVRSGKISQAGMTEETAVKVGKLLGVEYVMMGEVFEVRPGVIGVRSKLVKVKGSRVVIRLDAASNPEPSLTKSGTGTLVLSNANTFAKVVKPVIQQLTASVKAADL